MIITEFYMTRRDGVNLYRTYSDEGKYIERDGAIYEEAIDPEGTNRTYTETEEMIPVSVQPYDPEDAPDPLDEPPMAGEDPDEQEV